ncbi:protein MAIN-LIKE 2-like [Gastrolobium bilobum]|uniref:protein MAIN-LIKE 2-like n=1 Tax=Gastrolobium bilobum TaxID=150636 RepID=UPI002AB2D84F|nr:protein MAIN-LIKE 2-like [Gastrolobium bilobum]
MDERDYKSLTIRSGRLAGLDVIPEPIVPLLCHASFLGTVWMSRMELISGIISYGLIENDFDLVHGLLEVWRPETYTFHMLSGEVTVTLEDVAMIIDLPTNGELIIGMSETRDFLHLVPQLLGRTPNASNLKGGTLKMTWLDRRFSNVED